MADNFEESAEINNQDNFMDGLVNAVTGNDNALEPEESDAFDDESSQYDPEEGSGENEGEDDPDVEPEIDYKLKYELAEKYRREEQSRNDTRLSKINEQLEELKFNLAQNQQLDDPTEDIDPIDPDAYLTEERFNKLLNNFFEKKERMQAKEFQSSKYEEDKQKKMIEQKAMDFKARKPDFDKVNEFFTKNRDAVINELNSSGYTPSWDTAYLMAKNMMLAQGPSKRDKQKQHKAQQMKKIPPTGGRTSAKGRKGVPASNNIVQKTLDDMIASMRKERGSAK